MKIYKVERTDSWGYDDYDSFICVAPTPEAAQWMMPDEYYIRKEDGLYFQFSDGTEKKEDGPNWSPWATNISDIKVTEIGEAYSDNAEIILASYNAG